MAAISTSTADGTAAPQGQFIGLALNTVNLRASHTLMVRVKNGSTATNYHSVACGITAQSDLSGSFIGRANATTGTAMSWIRQGGFFSYTRDQTPRSTCYGNTTTWYHVCLVYNASTGQIRAYIDGTYIGQQASSTTRTLSSTANTIACACANGKFADFAFFNRDLSDSEVADMAAYRQPQVTSGLVAFWRLDSDGTDSSGNGNNGSVSGSGSSITWSTADNPPQPESPSVAISGTAASSSGLTGTITVNKPISGTASSSSGLTGQARSMIGGGLAASSSNLVGVMPKQISATAASSSDWTGWIRPRWGRRIGYVGAGSVMARMISSFPPNSPWTFMVWMKIVDLPVDTNSVLLDVSNPGAVDLARLWVRRTLGVLQTRISLTANSVSAIAYTATTDSNWHHLALTYDGTNARAYVDGSLVATAAAAPSSTSFNFVSYSVGASGSLAEMAHAKAWSGVALSASDIASEATFYTPHHNDSQVRWWWQLAWSNVTLDSSGNSQTLIDNGSLEAQSESPGQGFTNLASTAASSTEFPAAALAQNYAITGALGSSSEFPAAQLRQNFAITGTLASSSQLVATLVQNFALAGTTLETESEFPALALTTLKPLTPTALGSTSGLTGNLVQAQPLTPNALTSSSGFNSPTLLNAVVLAFNALASSTEFPAAVLALEHALTGPALTTTSQLTGNLGVTGVFGGVATTSSEFPSAALSVERALGGSSTTSSQLTASLLMLIDGSAETSSGLEAGISTLFGAMSSWSALQAELLVERDLEGILASSSGFTGALRALLPGATAASSSGLAATLSVASQSALAGLLESTTSFSATLSGGTTPAGGGRGMGTTRDRIGVAAGMGRRRVR